jgi:methylenetetrahydrofolate--tRNA-(uracil-5-)-methyltransferase
MEMRFQEKPKISVVGAGLAGSECALQLASLGYHVDLYEMREKNMTPAHKTGQFAELVCSNSFGSQSEGSAPQQLKWEAEKLSSEILKVAMESAVPAGQALSVDREIFAKTISQKIKNHPLIQVHTQIIENLAQVPRPTVIATGPLTYDKLAESMSEFFSSDQKLLYFFDAIAPIIDADSINTEVAWLQDRYDKGTPDYLNCPMNKDQYFTFINAVKEARKIEPKHFENTDFFEGCMPIEVMIDRGPHTPRFGPMKPVGLKAPGAEREPYAVVQLRQENKEATAYNMVGFQTRMAYSEQIRVFRMIPGLENAEFLKLGSIHRNLFINSPTLLNKDLSSKKDPWLFFAGQITGVEGYFESTCMGLLAARFLHARIRAQSEILPDSAIPYRTTAMGALLHAITDPEKAKHFQPTNINFGLLPPIDEPVVLNEKGKIVKDKNLKKQKQINRARIDFQEWLGRN